MDSGIWTVKSDGRLGNQMGEYATLYALAKMNGHQAYISPAMHQYLSPIFQITLPVINAEVAKKIRWRNFRLHDWRIINTSKTSISAKRYFSSSPSMTTSRKKPINIFRS
ncbi:galactoside 2-alpha-L-fucosyltransferase 2-like [Podarcis lilfordi]|uniref:L-Fucosyltransferase n=1 Tax=Podarcis lilfordi TaxID=74358 RepID=A0AA35PJ20_9SAUR|nr:galactoside 2-alpha-L-fucosyltransferase 2-like [Podarcis lilfordi]